MPWKSLNAVPRSIRRINGVPLTLRQVNALARRADELKKAGRPSTSAWAISVAAFQKSHKVSNTASGKRWVNKAR